MSVIAARDCAVYAGGTPVTMTGEACADIGGGSRLVYQVTSATKQVIDPATAVTVKDNGSAVTATDYALDYATGTVTFSVARTVGHTITIDAKYVPVLQIASAKSAKVTRPQPVFVDSTRMQDTARRQTEIAKTCSIVIEHMTGATEDLDAGAPTTYLDALIAGGVLFVRATLGDGKTLNGWFAVSSVAPHELNSVLTHTLTCAGMVQTCLGRPTTDQAMFSLT